MIYRVVLKLVMDLPSSVPLLPLSSIFTLLCPILGGHFSPFPLKQDIVHGRSFGQIGAKIHIQQIDQCDLKYDLTGRTFQIGNQCLLIKVKQVSHSIRSHAVSVLIPCQNLFFDVRGQNSIEIRSVTTEKKVGYGLNNSSRGERG